VLLAYLEQQARGTEIARPLPYMMTALRHAAQAHARATARQQPLEDDDGPMVEDAGLACLCSEVLAVMDRLPEKDRALLHQAALGDATPSELSRELGVPVGTIMSRLARARARLRDELGITSLF
jgi:RNA polymerase sigma-70 factor (ECF subfamily)